MCIWRHFKQPLSLDSLCPFQIPLCSQDSAYATIVLCHKYLTHSLSYNKTIYHLKINQYCSSKQQKSIQHQHDWIFHLYQKKKYGNRLDTDSWCQAGADDSRCSDLTCCTLTAQYQPQRQGDAYIHFAINKTNSTSVYRCLRTVLGSTLLLHKFKCIYDNSGRCVF